jgi:TonB family protein
MQLKGNTIKLLTLILLLFLTGCSLLKHDGYVRSHEECFDVHSCVAKITEIIENTWYIPDSYTEGLEVKFRVKLANNKTIISISILESSGNREFDMSAVEAIKKIHTMVELNGLDDETYKQNFKQFSFSFKPDINA